MDTKAEALRHRSICEIRFSLPNGIGTGYGNGVFITPSHILTSWHVVSGAKKGSLNFENHVGDKAMAKVGGLKLSKRECDLCIIEMDKPIGDNIYTRPINRHLLSGSNTKKSDNIGTLFAKNIRGNRTVTQNVKSMNYLRSIFVGLKVKGDNDFGVDSSKLSIYGIEDEVLRPGHSGSPTIDKNGHIISLTSCMVPRDDADISDIFKGPSSEQIADFVDSFLFSPESVHNPEEPRL